MTLPATRINTTKVTKVSKQLIIITEFLKSSLGSVKAVQV